MLWKSLNKVSIAMQVVKFKGVTYGAEIRGAKEGFETVGSVAMKCLFACCAEKLTMQKFKVLDNCSGYLMPGTLTLVCGPPGCGKLTIMLETTEFLSSIQW